MKKLFIFIIGFLTTFSVFACNESTDNTSTISSLVSTTGTLSTTDSSTNTTEVNEFIYNPITVEEHVLEEARLSFKFFWEVANGNSNSEGYGLVADRYNTATSTPGAASIASVGFALAAIPIGIENDWIGYLEGYERVLGTLNTLDNMQRTHGFYYHFVNMENGSRAGYSEVSIIDTAILICGVILAGEYFGGEIKSKANDLYQAVEWDWYYNDVAKMFYMGYTPENGFEGYWDSYAEQLMIYLLAAASDNYSVGIEAYEKMKLNSQRKQYGTSDYFYVSYPGTLFTYQYSHAFFDFRTAMDNDYINWFNNSIEASIAAYDYAQFMSTYYKTYDENSWGNTASDGPDGYRAYGNLPAAGQIYIDGTLAPGGAIGSLPFVPDLVLPTMEYFSTLEKLQGKYGLLDSFNLGLTSEATNAIIRPVRPIPVDGWFATDVIGIDKGISLLMIENYRSEMIWYYFMQSEIIQKGFEELDFTVL